MGDEIQGELNNTAPVCQPGVDNFGATVESDNDLDAPASGGHVDVAKFPSKAPGVEAQQKKAVENAKKSPKGDDATAQTYLAQVPFSTSALQLGSAKSAGGAGASLTTAGNIFVGATGKLGMQSLAAFTGQTNAAMGIFSKVGVTAHSQNKFEIYAGGGDGPGACGGAAPAGTTGPTVPAQAAERWTNVGCNVLGVAKAANDLYNAGKSFQSSVDALKGLKDAKTAAKVVGGLKVLADVASGAKAVTDMGSKGYSAVAGITTDPDDEKALKAKKKSAKEADKVSADINATSGGISLLSAAASAAAGKPGDAISSLLGGVSSLVSAGSSASGAHDGTSFINDKEDGPVEGSEGATESVPKKEGEGGGGGGEGGGGGGPLDIEKRASAKIHQCCNIKITGNAPEGIDFKVGGAFLVNSVAAVEFSTTNWGAFAAVMFKVRSMVLIEVKCRKFEMKALAKGKMKTVLTVIEASTLSTLDGVTTVTETLVVEEHSTLHDTLHVEKDQKTVIEGNLTVEKDATKKKNAKFHKACHFKEDVTIKGQYTSHSALTAAGECKFG